MNKTRRIIIILTLLLIAVFSWSALTACNKETSGKTVESIEVTKQPDKTSYVEGEKFSAAGMEITAKYSDGTTEKESEYTFSPEGALAVSNTEITVTYNSKTAKVAITVQAKSLTGLSVTAAPTKTEYYIGEIFDKSGMKVTASYDNGATALISDYTCDKSALKYGDTKVTIAYGGKTAETSVTVLNSVKIEAENTRIFSSTVKISGDSATASGNYIGELRTGNSVCIDFTSTAAGTVTFTLRASTVNLTEVVSGWIPTVMADTQLNQVANIYINGTAVTIPDTALLKGGEAADKTAGDNDLWFLWTEVSLEDINVKEGENSIVLEFKSSGIKNYWGNELTANIDSFKIAFDGEITGEAIPLPGYNGILNNEYTTKYTNTKTLEAENASRNAGKIEDQDSASGGKSIGSTAGSGNYVTFPFMMQEGGTGAIKLVAACAKWDGDVGGNVNMENLGSYINLKINGNPVDLSKVDLVCKDKNDWVNWQSIIIDGVKLAVGKNTVTITMKDNGGYYCPNLDVLYVYTDAAFLARAVDSIEVTKQPAKTNYIEGEEFDTKGMVITAKFNDDTTENVTDYTFSPNGALTAADKEITVTYSGLTLKITINVEVKVLTGIAVTTEPTKIEYYIGEAFDKNGMVVTATYDNGTTAIIANYTCDKTQLAYGDTKVTITYGEKTVETAVTVLNAVKTEAESARKTSSTAKVNSDSNTASGGSYLGDIKAGDSLFMDFTSSAAGTVSFTMRASTINLTEVVSGWIPIVMADTQLNKVAEIYVNGVAVTIPDTALLKGGEAADKTAGDNSLWCLWTNISFDNIAVAEGANTIEVRFISSGMKNFWDTELTANFDSLEIAYDGSITGTAATVS